MLSVCSFRRISRSCFCFSSSEICCLKSGIIFREELEIFEYKTFLSVNFKVSELLRSKLDHLGVQPQGANVWYSCVGGPAKASDWFGVMVFLPQDLLSHKQYQHVWNEWLSHSYDRDITRVSWGEGSTLSGRACGGSAEVSQPLRPRLRDVISSSRNTKIVSKRCPCAL